MADFIFAIVVPLASPIQPVATSKLDTGVHVAAAHLTGAWGVQDFSMVPAAPAVNSSIRGLRMRRQATSRRGPAGAMQQSDEHPSAPSFGDVIATQQTTCAERHVQNDMCRCTNHPTVRTILLLASCFHRAKLVVPVATGVVRQSSSSLNLVCRAQSRSSRVRRMCAT
jgi:hypothetical protein